MEGLVVILIGLVAAIPITLIVLLLRVSNLKRRVNDLEAAVIKLKRASVPVQPAPSAQPTLEGLLQTRHPPEPAPTPAPFVPPPLAAPPLVFTEAPRPPEPVPPPLASPTPPRVVDWEKFLGVKLFAWVGGLALFLGIAFFIKYSFEHNLIPPAMRVALGFVTGLGLVLGGLLMRRREYAVTSQTLCATGIVVLYAVSFAAHGVYNLIGSGTVFAIMTLVTAAAFTLAIRLDAKVVAVLGLVGGFLTPPLLSTGQDHPLGLFGYIALLDLGLIAVATNRRWHFLFLLGAIGTGIMELGWLFKFFEPAKTLTLITIVAVFNLLQAAAFSISERLTQSNRESVVASVIQAAVTFFAALYLNNLSAMASHPGALLCIILIADLALLVLPLIRHDLFRVQMLAGGATLCVLGSWLRFTFRQDDLYWALTATLAFALLHSAYPLLLQRRRKTDQPMIWLNAFPLASIALMLLVLLQLDTVSLLLWPVVFLLDLLVIGLAFLTASLAATLGAVILTSVFTAAWLFRLPRDASGDGLVLILGLFALLFFAAGIWLCRKTAEASAGQNRAPDSPLDRYLPALPAIMPFLLLTLMVSRLNLPDPSTVFGLALLLSGMLLWLGARTGADEVSVVALGASFFLENYWHQLKLQPERSGLALTWYLLFYALFMAHPFLFRKKLQERIWPWVTSALSGPVHFYLIYKASLNLLPGFDGMGLVPAVLAIPSILALAAVVKRFEVSEPQRTRLLALFGGSSLFFITMVVPIQFSRQWLTLGWALEGTALLWLFTRVPHRGLPIVGVALLVTAFARLALNPNVFSYYARSATPILNWYLYSYGLVSACLLVGGRLLSPPRNLMLGRNVRPLLFTLGTILAFMLLNIEIADFFAEGDFLRFEFSGNFARDMTYSIAWGLFALVLLLLGIRQSQAPVRYASLALLGVTLLKLFFHDLSQLGQLYRIGAFIGVAVILIFASWIYQRFLASGAPKKPS